MTTRIIPYEILFRLNQSGEVVGCHRRDLKVMVDGADTFEKELDPVAIEGAEMEAVLGQLNTALVGTLAFRDIQIATLEDEKTKMRNELNEFREKLSAEHEALFAAYIELKIRLGEADDLVTVGKAE